MFWAVVNGLRIVSEDFGEFAAEMAMLEDNVARILWVYVGNTAEGKRVMFKNDLH